MKMLGTCVKGTVLVICVLLAGIQSLPSDMSKAIAATYVGGACKCKTTTHQHCTQNSDSIISCNTLRESRVAVEDDSGNGTINDNGHQCEDGGCATVHETYCSAG